MKLVIDTSVAIKWFVEEVGSEMAVLLVKPDFERLGPELVVAETANVLQRKVRVGELTNAQATEALNSLPHFYDRLTASVDIVNDGFGLSQALDHSVYDCLYLALALKEGAQLVTSDAKFLAKAKSAGFGQKIWDLEAAMSAAVTEQENENG